MMTSSVYDVDNKHFTIVEPCFSDLIESLWVVGAIVSLRHGLSPGAELSSSLTVGRKWPESNQESYWCAC